MSDAYRVHVCKDCGMLAVANLRTQTFQCRACKSFDSIVQVRWNCDLQSWRQALKAALTFCGLLAGC